MVVPRPAAAGEVHSDWSLGASCRVVRIKKEPTAISVASLVRADTGARLLLSGPGRLDCDSVAPSWEVADSRVLSDLAGAPLLVGGGGELCLVHGFD